MPRRRAGRAPSHFGETGICDNAKERIRANGLYFLHWERQINRFVTVMDSPVPEGDFRHFRKYFKASTTADTSWKEQAGWGVNHHSVRLLFFFPLAFSVVITVVEILTCSQLVEFLGSGFYAQALRNDAPALFLAEFIFCHDSVQRLS